MLWKQFVEQTVSLRCRTISGRQISWKNFRNQIMEVLNGTLDEEQFCTNFISIVAASYHENGMALFINMTKQR